jgi:cytidylate kinase
MAEDNMTKSIISINRQYGSGGREVGELLANKLGYAYYDKELIRRISQVGEVDFDLVNASGEGLTGKISSILLHWGAEGKDEDSLPLPDRLFLVQGRTVKQIASEGPCVIIGHLADYFLEGNPDLLTVFVHSEWEARKARVMARNALDERDAVARIKRIDRNRMSFYEQYTERRWGKAANYDLSLSSSTFGIEEAADIITQIVCYYERAGEGMRNEE